MSRRPWWSFVILAASLAGCSAVPENHYFTMSYVLLPAWQSETTYPATLRVRPLEIAPAYDMERIVYRYSPYEFQYYNYMLWAAKPQKMVTDLVVRHLQHSKLFYDVGYEYRDRQPDYEMFGFLHAVEEQDSGNEWFAHLAFSLRMTRFRDDRVVWSYDVNVKKQVYNKEPVYVVRALSELLEDEMKKVTARLRKFLRQEEAKPRSPGRDEPDRESRAEGDGS